MRRIGIDASRAFVNEPTGTERYSYEVITRILRLPEAKEHEWILYTKKITPSLIPSFSLRGGKGVIFKEISMKHFWTQAGLACRTWVDKLDVLWVPAHTLPVFRKPGIKTIVTIHGIEYEWLPAYENLLQRWYLPLSTKYAVLSASKIIAVSEFTKKQLRERLGGDQKKIKVVYEGYSPQIPNSKFQQPNKSQILNRYKIKAKQYLLFVGTIQPRKNLERLVEAFSALSTKYLGLSLVIAGKRGWLYGGVMDAIKKYKLEHKVVITGYIEDEVRQELLNQALVYVQPSITEGFGLPVLEAMAAGVPVASSNGGALTEVVGDAGVLFDPLNVEEIVNSIEFIVHSSKQRQKLIEKGLERVKIFGWENAARETYDLIVEKQ